MTAGLQRNGVRWACSTVITSARYPHQGTDSEHLPDFPSTPLPEARLARTHFADDAKEAFEVETHRIFTIRGPTGPYRTTTTTFDSTSARELLPCLRVPELT